MDITLQLINKDGVDHIHYVGPINEEAEVHLAQVQSKVGAKVVVNFKQVEYINSCGVRAWINFMRELEKNRQVTFEECTSEIVMQMNMIPSFRGNAKVKSVYAAYDCENCGNKENKLFEAGKNLPEDGNFEFPPVHCSKCKHEMEMEELEDEYFAFLEAS